MVNKCDFCESARVYEFKKYGKLYWGCQNCGVTEELEEPTDDR